MLNLGDALPSGEMVTYVTSQIIGLVLCNYFGYMLPGYNMLRQMKVSETRVGSLLFNG